MRDEPADDPPSGPEIDFTPLFFIRQTFPDKPTRYGLNQTVTAWQALRESNGNVTYSELETFLNDYFVSP